MKVGIVVGTRPEIIKMMPVVKESQRRGIDFFIIHSNQHYSENMDKVFFEELQLPNPRYNLNVGSGKHSNMTGNILIKMEPILEQEKPDVVLVQGDTNTVLAAALAASKLGIKVGHIEAGLRSYDRTMPEETNRIVTDHISDYLFAVTSKQNEILLSEGISKNKIHVVGNTVVDALVLNTKTAKNNSKVLEHHNLESKNYFLITIHRASNVDRRESLEEVIDILNVLSEKYSNYDLVWPIHPRTQKYIEEYNIDINCKIKLLDPCGYIDFIKLQNNARLIITDSGGIQEEACCLKVPCITIRNNTERPETLEVGSNVLTGRKKDAVLYGTETMLKRETDWLNPFGEGNTSKKIFDILSKDFGLRENITREEKVTVIGLGYMGLPMASIIANSGFQVTGVDLNESKIETVNNGMCPFDEKGMPELVKKAVDSGKLRAQSEIPKSDIFLLSLPTDKKDNKCDLSVVLAVCNQLKDTVEDGNLIIIESTIKPNTIKSIIAPIFKHKKVHLAHCPERAIPGNTVYELVQNDRIIGGLTSEATELTYSFYLNFIEGKMYKTDSSTAECAKLMENTFRDVNIALANEFDYILDELKVNTSNAIRLANKHPRVNILTPGPGVGGHCIAIDPWFLIEDSSKAKLIRNAREINDKRPYNVVEKVLKKLAGHKKIGLFGIAYKPDVDDARETPAKVIFEELIRNGFEVRCSDPFVKNWDHQIFSSREVLEWSDINIIVTGHSEYKDKSIKKFIRL
ncbi:non-hydrolyzing UDP-N-acetylglucosamine 2-epimerase [Halobacteriovorax sp. ZH5_bin.2]|uniref:non-hydrolyzing UDP-N-acetylglucosamine 2-epimerase n=1 Tax=Halobacteriovorax sp. ZH5_bin.2 TaxID=3157727 RepID=UPI0037199EEA